MLQENNFVAISQSYMDGAALITKIEIEDEIHLFHYRHSITVLRTREQLHCNFRKLYGWGTLISKIEIKDG